MNILHIATDEKFINSISWQFNEINIASNEFIILVEASKKNLKYVNLKKNFQIVLKNKKGLKYCVDQTKKYDIIIFHGLNHFQSQIILRVDNKSNIIWCFWGGGKI